MTLACGAKVVLISRLAGLNSSADSIPCCESQVVIILKIEPKLRRQTEVFPQANGSVSADGPRSADDLIDAGKTESLGQFISTHAHGLHELGLENLARVDRKNFSGSGHDCFY